MEERIMEFIVNDESVNRYGYWIRTEGIETEKFMKNPVFLYQHNQEDASIGKVVELRKEEGKLIAKVEFDGGDELAMKIYRKYKEGYMNAVSMSLIVKKTTEEEEWLKEGQKQPTVLESELLEISAVTLPGNANAVKLYNAEGKEIKLDFLKNKNQQIENKDEKSKQFIKKTNYMEENIKKLENEIAMLKSEIENLKKLRAEAMVEAHIERGAISEAEKIMYVEKALKDYEGVKEILNKKQGKEVIEHFLAQKDHSKPIAQSYRQLAATNPEKLLRMFKEDFDQFNKLFKEEYGVDYKK